MARKSKAQQQQAQEQNQINGGNVEMAKKEIMVSTIKFCREVGIKNPQQMYQLLQKKQVPEEVLQYQQVGDKFQPFFKLESATQWWLARKAKSAVRKSTVIAQSTDQVLARFADMVNEVAKSDPEVAKLADLLVKVMKSQGGVQ